MTQDIGIFVSLIFCIGMIFFVLKFMKDAADERELREELSSMLNGAQDSMSSLRNELNTKEQQRKNLAELLARSNDANESLKLSVSQKLRTIKLKDKGAEYWIKRGDGLSRELKSAKEDIRRLLDSFVIYAEVEAQAAERAAEQAKERVSQIGHKARARVNLFLSEIEDIRKRWGCGCGQTGSGGGGGGGEDRPLPVTGREEAAVAPPGLLGDGDRQPGRAAGVRQARRGPHLPPVHHGYDPAADAGRPTQTDDPCGAKE